MKKYLFGCIGIFLLPAAATADTLTLVTCDTTYYDETGGIGPAGTPANYLTGVSDIYYYYKPFSHELTLTQTEWLSDGHGNEYPAPYESVFHYTNITFDNMADTMGYLIRDIDIENLKNQFFEYQTTTNAPHMQAMNSTKYILLQQNTNIMNLAFNRLHTKKHRNNTKRHTNTTEYNIWGQTFYNHSHHDGDTGFSSNSFGLALGADKQITDFFNLGFGYNYNTATITDLNIDNNILFVYGRYYLTDLFIDASFGINAGNYKINDDEAKGKINATFGSLLIGQDSVFGFAPHIGLRYIHTKILPHSDYIEKYDTDIATFVFGVNYDSKTKNSKKASLNSHINLTYDFVTPDNDIVMNIPEIHYVGYNLHDSIKPFGLEGGISLKIPMGRGNMFIGYDINLRSQYISHTGTMHIKYDF